MSYLLSVIRRHDKYAARVLEKAGFQSDWDMKTLTREDLRDLFQEPGQLELRGKIFELINTQKQLHEPLRKVKECILMAFLRAALAGNGMLVDHLSILKGLKIQMTDVQEFLDAHISYLEKIRNDIPQTESVKVMSDLLSVIRRHDENAAHVLEEAGIRSDWELKALTREDLRDLFQGSHQLKVRGKILEIINTHKPVDELLTDVKEFIPEECLMAALTDNGVLADYLCNLKDQKVPMSNDQEFHDAHINFLEKIGKDTPQTKSEKVSCATNNDQSGDHPPTEQGYSTMVEVKSDLLSVIKRQDKNAARVLEEAGFQSDWKLKTLTREDLRELFHRSDQLELRGKIFEIINTQKPVDELLRKVKDFIPGEYLRAALTDSGVLVDYLHILKDQKVQMRNVEEFHDAHINFLEKIRKDTRQTAYKKASCATNIDQSGDHPSTVLDAPTARVPTAASACPDQHLMGQNKSEDFIEVSRQDVLKDTVRYKMVVSGKTFGTHQVILDRLKEQVQLAESRDNHQITIVFCAISTRVGFDVDAALAEVKDDKPIILVLMHHSREPTVTTSVRTWAHDDNDANVILHVDVFYHETSGLLKCQQNYDAFSVIQNKLVATFPKSHVQGNPPPKKGKKDSESGKDNDKSGGGVRSWLSEKTSQLPKPW